MTTEESIEFTRIKRELRMREAEIASLHEYISDLETKVCALRASVPCHARTRSG